MDNLYTKKCAPCEGGVEPMRPEEFSTYLAMINNWQVKEDNLIEKTFEMKDFVSAIVFINKIAQIAEEEGHHPDILLYNWNKVKIMLTTHAIGGLSINDFIMASKIDRI